MSPLLRENGRTLMAYVSGACLKNRHGQRNLAGYSPWGLKVKDRTEAEVYSLELEAGEL